MDSDIIIQMDKILDEVSDDVRKASREGIAQVPKEAVKKLRATSPRRIKGGKQKGRYARGWRVKIEDTDAIVYNATDAGLTHLLENGHAMPQGGRSRAIPHIKPVEAWAAEELPRRILEGIE